jgi:nitric oxide dioxygenase
MIFESQEEVVFTEENKLSTEWRSFVVKCKVEETEEITSFYLEPQNEEELPEYISGQSVDIRIYIPKENSWIISTHSLSCTSNKVFFRISVTRDFRIENNFNNYFYDHINEGDILELAPPYGKFVLQDTAKNKVFISEGFGQVSLLAMIETLDLENNLIEEIVWIHECKSIDFHAFKSKLKGISNDCKNLKIFSFYKENKSAVNNEDYCFIGEIDINKIKDWKPDLDSEYYICGSNLFVNKQILSLYNRGIGKENVFISKI